MFEHDLTNHVPQLDFTKCATDLKLLVKAFEKASDWANMVGLSDFCGYNEKGTKESNNKFPYRLIFHPTEEVHTAFSSKP